MTKKSVAKQLDNLSEFDPLDQDQEGHESGDLVDRLIKEWHEENASLDTSAMALVGRFILIGRMLEARTDAALKDTGLKYSDFDVLATLRRSGAPYELMPKQLMNSVLLTSGAMTALLNRLERRGLITRRSGAADGRVKTARLTARGKKLIDRAVVVRFADAKDAMSYLDEDEHARLEAALRDAVQALCSLQVK